MDTLLTTKQLDFIENLEEQLEYNRFTTLNLANEIRGERMQHLSDLTKKEASKLIAQLLELKG